MLNHENKMLLQMNDFIHSKNQKYSEYHRNHIDFVKQYAIILNERLGFHLNNHKLTYIAYSHDLLKEKGLTKEDREWKGYHIPMDVGSYVRMNLDILAKYEMDDYFNTSTQYHALAAGIFLDKEFHVHDKEIIYPVMFHSCPIISIYKSLPTRTQQYIDIIMLSDKLSSNWIRINQNGESVKVDLEKAVFGLNGNELHYLLGLYLARKLTDDKDKYAKEATEYYGNRLIEENMSWLSLSKLDLGGKKEWPKRKSPLLKMN